jgi:hypothetical protein
MVLNVPASKANKGEKCCFVINLTITLILLESLFVYHCELYVAMYKATSKVKENVQKSIVPFILTCLPCTNNEGYQGQISMKDIIVRFRIL